MKYASKMKQQQQQLKPFFVPKSKGTQSTDTTWTEDLKVADPPTGIALAVQVQLVLLLPSAFLGMMFLIAEVLWAIKTVMLYYSKNSSSYTGELFKKMFPREPNSPKV